MSDKDPVELREAFAFWVVRSSFEERNGRPAYALYTGKPEQNEQGCWSYQCGSFLRMGSEVWMERFGSELARDTPALFDALVATDEPGTLALPYARHCDRYDGDFSEPDCLRWWVLMNRLPAVAKMLAREMIEWPNCYAKHDGRWCRLVIASRFGDVGITYELDSEQYKVRVALDQLTDFQAEKPSG